MSETYDLVGEGPKDGPPIDQGAKYRLEAQLLEGDADSEPQDLDGYTARMQIRKHASAPTAVLDVSDGEGITIGDEGSIVVALTAAQTRAIPAGAYVYDLELYPGGQDLQTLRLLEGRVVVSAEVTREDA